MNRSTFDRIISCLLVAGLFYCGFALSRNPLPGNFLPSAAAQEQEDPVQAAKPSSKPTMMLAKFEDVHVEWGHSNNVKNTLSRTKVPGGWLVVAERWESSDRANEYEVAGITFYP